MNGVTAWRALALVAIVTAFPAMPRLAQADEAHRPTAASNAEMTEAETRFQEGLALYEKGSINEARVKLVQAYAVLGRPNILWNLAVAEFYSSRTLESIRHMRKLLKAPDADPRDLKVARETFIPALEKVTGRIAVTAPKGLSVTVDGEPAGLAPLADPIDVLPGRHVVVASGPNGSSSIDVEVLAGQAVAATVADTGESGSSKDPTARPAAAPSLADERERSAEPDSPTARNVTVIALGGSALVATAIGIGFLAKASAAEDEAATIRGGIGGGPASCAQTSTPDCMRLREATADEASFSNVSTGFFAGAVALAVGAGLTYLLWPSRQPPARARGGFAPAASGGGELHFHVTF